MRRVNRGGRWRGRARSIAERGGLGPLAAPSREKARKRARQGFAAPNELTAAEFQSVFCLVFMPGLRCTDLPAGVVPTPR